MTIHEFDFDALNPAFSDLGAIIDEVDEYIEELDTELLEGDFDDETNYMDEDGLWDADDEDVEPAGLDFSMYLDYD